MDKCPELAQQFGVMSIPTLILFKDGQVVDTLVGYHPKAALEDLIKKGAVSSAYPEKAFCLTGRELFSRHCAQ